MYANDEYILVDGCKQAVCIPIMELSKAARFPPCCFPYEAYALPASMYTCQIWGTRFMKEGAEMD
eukprot:158899-Pelagomonas_calceolata.AAC.1